MTKRTTKILAILFTFVSLSAITESVVNTGFKWWQIVPPNCIAPGCGTYLYRDLFLEKEV